MGFSKEDRDTNIPPHRLRCAAWWRAAGGVAITAAISPYREVRDEVRAETPGFVEVFVRCPLDTLVERDVKGLYKKAIAGEIANFTGVSDPYEDPLHPEVVVDTSRESLQQSLSKVIDALERLGHLDRPVRRGCRTTRSSNSLRAEALGLARLEGRPARAVRPIHARHWCSRATGLVHGPGGLRVVVSSGRVGERATFHDPDRPAS